MLVDHAADGQRDVRGATQRLALARGGQSDTREIAFGGRQQFLALAGALGGEIAIAANDQTFAGEVRAGDAGHVALVEQGQLQGPAFHQILDRRGAQRGDPIEPGGFDVFGQPGLGDHAAITDQHDVVEHEALFQLRDLRSERLRVAGIAVEDLDGDRAAVGRAEQAIDDLQGALASVPAVAAMGQGTAASFHVARGDVVEHQRAVS